MPRIRVSLTLTFETPPSVGAGGSAGTLADKVVLRNARGQFIIPASQVRGKLRHACERLLRAEGIAVCGAPEPDSMCPNADGVRAPCPVCALFGSPGQFSLLRFHDLEAASQDLPGETLRAMVSLNRGRRTAEEQRLFLVETAPNVRGLRFSCEEAIVGHVPDAAYAHLLLATLGVICAWGGSSSRGLGWASAEATAFVNGAAVDRCSAEEVRRLCNSWK